MKKLLIVTIMMALGLACGEDEQCPSDSSLPANDPECGVDPDDSLGSTSSSQTSTSSTSSTTSSTTATLSSLSVSSSATSVLPGSTLQLVATATYSDATTQDVSSSATWSSSSTSLATVSTSGLVSGVSQGSVSITATLDSVSGSTNLTIGEATLQSIAVTGSSSSVTATQTLSLTATGTDSAGTTTNLTSGATWSSSDTSIATVSSGVVTGVSVGTATITATSGTKSGTYSVTVTQNYDLCDVAVASTQGSSEWAVFGSTRGVAQVFTAANDFNLNNLGLKTRYSSGSDPRIVDVKLYSYSSGDPDSGSLILSDSLTITSTSVTYEQLTFSSPSRVTAGTYALVFVPQSNFWFYVPASSGDEITGSGYRNPSGTWIEETGKDALMYLNQCNPHSAV